MKSLPANYLEGYAILQLILRNYRGVPAFRYLNDVDRLRVRTILDVDVDDYHIKVTYNGRYGKMELMCPYPLFDAVTSNVGNGWHVVDLKDICLDDTHNRK